MGLIPRFKPLTRIIFTAPQQEEVGQVSDFFVSNRLRELFSLHSRFKVARFDPLTPLSLHQLAYLATTLSPNPAHFGGAQTTTADDAHASFLTCQKSAFLVVSKFLFVIY